MNTQRVEDAFRKNSFGRRFSEDLYREIREVGVLRSFKRGGILFHEGDEAAGLFFLLKGMIKLTRFTPDGREVILHLAEPPTFVAEAGLFLGSYPATGIGLEGGEYLLIRREDVSHLMEHHHEFLHYIFDTMAMWLKQLLDKINQLTLNDATTRLACYLIQLSDKEHEEDEKSDVAVHLPMKKGELATMLNMNQATLSRALRVFQDSGILEVQARDLTVRNVRALRRFLLPRA